MEQSILTGTKSILGVAEDYTVFDLDIITHINAAFSVLHQLGVGPIDGFYIQDETAVWTDFDPNGPILSLVRTYVFLKTRLLFDPPATSFLIKAMTDQIDQYEWRLTTLEETV